MDRIDTGNAWLFLVLLIVISAVADLPVIGEPLAERLTAYSLEQGRYDREFAEITASYE